MDVLFTIIRQKAELKPQAAIAKPHHDEKESFARIAALRVPLNIAAPAGSTRMRGKNEQVLLGKIFPIILSAAGHYSGLLKAKIAQIHEDGYKSENLYRFYYCKDREDKDKDKNIIFKYGQTKIKMVTSTLRNFGNTINI